MGEGCHGERIDPAVVELDCKVSLPAQSMLHNQPLLSAEIVMRVVRCLACCHGSFLVASHGSCR